MRALPLFIAVLISTPAEAGDPVPAYPSEVTCPDDLVRMSECQLLDLYRRAAPGPIPDGYAPGKAIPNPGKPGTAFKSKIIGATAWQGKNFDPDGTMTNRMFGTRMVTARTSYDASWLDGKPSLVLDYRGSSKVVWARCRDELREVAPGIYLGLMYRDACPAPKLRTFFVIDARGCGH
jgi:hypothetical protein